MNDHDTNTVISTVSLNSFVLTGEPVKGILKTKGASNTKRRIKFSLLINWDDSPATGPSVFQFLYVSKGLTIMLIDDRDTVIEEIFYNVKI